MRQGSLAIGSPKSPGATPLVVAHRGAWGLAPQNSLAAFEEAVQLGCDAVELDVRRTLDGRVVVVHDARAGVRPIAKLTHEQVQSRPRHRHLPALEAVLDLIAGRIGVDVELKEDGYVEQAMAIVKRRLAPEQYVVTSFRDSVLPTVKRTAPAARTGLLLNPNRQLGQLPRSPQLRVAKATLKRICEICREEQALLAELKTLIEVHCPQLLAERGAHVEAASALNDYLAHYPQGRFVREARERLAQLQAAP